MEFLNHVRELLYLVLAPLLAFLLEIWQWWLAQILSVPWGNVGQLPASKILLLIASTGIVGYVLLRTVRELLAAGAKAVWALATLLRVLAKTVPSLLVAGLAAAAGAWVVNHVHL